MSNISVLLREKTTFGNIVYVPYHPCVVDRHDILLFSVTRHSSIPTIKRWWRSDPLGLVSSLSGISKSLLVKFSLRGLSTPDGPRLSYSSSISMGFDYLLQSPCSMLLFLLSDLSWSRNLYWNKEDTGANSLSWYRHNMFLLVYIFWIFTCHKMECRCGNQYMYLDFTDTYNIYHIRHSTHSLVMVKINKMWCSNTIMKHSYITILPIISRSPKKIRYLAKKNRTRKKSNIRNYPPPPPKKTNIRYQGTPVPPPPPLLKYSGPPPSKLISHSHSK